MDLGTLSLIALITWPAVSYGVTWLSRRWWDNSRWGVLRYGILVIVVMCVQARIWQSVSSAYLTHESLTLSERGLQVCIFVGVICYNVIVFKTVIKWVDWSLFLNDVRSRQD